MLTMERPRKHDAMRWALSLFQEEQRYGRWGAGLRGRNVIGPRETQGLDASQFQKCVGLASEERRRKARGEISQGHLVDVITAAGYAM